MNDLLVGFLVGKFLHLLLLSVKLEIDDNKCCILVEFENVITFLGGL